MTDNENSSSLKWYEKKAGITKNQKEKAQEKKDIRKKRRESESKNDSKKNTEQNNTKDSKKTEVKFIRKKTLEKNAPKRKPLENNFLNSLFNKDNIPEDALKILNEFQEIALSVVPLTSKQRSLLPSQIRELSHNLTDERSSRRLSYMNQTETLTSYIHYFMWWNLVRLTRLFANLPADYFDFATKAKDDEKIICLDIGSGPLTLPLALFLARPELRSKKLVWYCMDISAQSLSNGENIFLTISAKLACEPWSIIRVKGEMGTQIKEKVRFVTSANAFNEIIEDASMPPDFLAKKYTEKLLSYADNSDAETRVLLVEPGVPTSARFISLMRAALMRKGFIPVSPCPHCGECPMEGKKGGKWCNLVFKTVDAPNALKKLSEAAQLPKERAVLSFIACKKGEIPEIEATTKKLSFRIASDPIRLPGGKTGFYACSQNGLLLVETQSNLKSGDMLEVKLPRHPLKTDQKSNALILHMD